MRVLVHFQKVFRCDLRLRLAHTVLLIKERRRQILNLNLRLIPDINGANSRKNQILQCLNPSPSAFHKGNLRSPETPLPTRPPQSDLSIVLVYFYLVCWLWVHFYFN